MDMLQQVSMLVVGSNNHLVLKKAAYAAFFIM